MATDAADPVGPNGGNPDGGTSKREPHSWTKPTAIIVSCLALVVSLFSTLVSYRSSVNGRESAQTAKQSLKTAREALAAGEPRVYALPGHDTTIGCGFGDEALRADYKWLDIDAAVVNQGRLGSTIEEADLLVTYDHAGVASGYPTADDLPMVLPAATTRHVHFHVACSQLRPPTKTSAFQLSVGITLGNGRYVMVDFNFATGE